MHSDRAGLYDEARIRHTRGSKRGGSFRQLPYCDAADDRRSEATRRRCGTRSRTELAVCDPARFSQADFIQDGFCGGRVYLRIADEPGRAHSYRNVAYAMYEAVARKYPALARYLRVHDMREAVDLLKR